MQRGGMRKRFFPQHLFQTVTCWIFGRRLDIASGFVFDAEQPRWGQAKTAVKLPGRRTYIIASYLSIRFFLLVLLFFPFLNTVQAAVTTWTAACICNQKYTMEN